LASYNGVLLKPCDVEVLKIIEELTSPIPVLDELIFNEFGFTYENNRVISLMLPNKQLSNLPHIIANLTELKYLNLYNNHLKEFPNINLNNLEYLNLYNNEFYKIPVVGNQLLYLNLADNHIDQSNININSTNLSIPFKYLQVLRLEYNQITAIDNLIPTDENSNFTNLISLNLNFNEIRELPADINKLVNLEELSIWGNNLTKLPRSITKLPKLKKLEIKANLQIRTSTNVFYDLRKNGCEINWQPAYVDGRKPPEGGSSRFWCPPKHYYLY